MTTTNPRPVSDQLATAGVTNYDLAVEALDELQVKRADLIDEHDNARRPSVIARLNQDIRDAHVRARSHSQLAVADAVREFRTQP